MLPVSLVLPAWMALGEPPQVAWQAGEGCPSAGEVMALTAEVLGHELDDGAAIELDARIHSATGGGQHLQLWLSVDGIEEQHELWASDCVRLSEDVAFLLASALDPFVMWQQPSERRELVVPPIQRPRARVVRTEPAHVEPERREPVRRDLEPDEPASHEPASSSTEHDFGPLELATDTPDDERSSRRLRGSLGVSGSGFVGLFPNVGGGVQLEGGIERGLWRWRVGAEGWFGGRFRTPANVGADLLAVSGSTGVCVVPHVRRVAFELCALGGAGGLQATPVNTTSTAAIFRPWGFVGADARVNWTPRPGLGLFLGVSVLPALARPVWAISNPETILVTPPVTGVLRLGVELRAANEERP